MDFSKFSARFVPWAHRGLQGALIFLIFFVIQMRRSEWIKALETVAWLFVGYMSFRLVLILLQNPSGFTYRIPDTLRIPHRITELNLPRLVNPSLAAEEGAVWQLISTLCLKIQSQTDEVSVHMLMNERIRNLRSQAYTRFGDVSRELNTLAFEGIIGTLLGMMVFMAQTSKLLTLPDLNDGDASVLASALLKNLQDVDFIVVLSAFITSVIGWTAKAWIGHTIDRRRDQELNSLIQVESFLQMYVLARLSLPSRTVVAHTLTRDTWMELTQAQLFLRVHHVEGGFLLVPEVQKPSSGSRS